MGPVSSRPTLVLTVTDETRLGTDPMAIKQKVEKLHKQFSHPDGDSLKKLLKKAGFEREEYTKAIDDVSKKCKVCSFYKNQKPMKTQSRSGK